jgi:hypothetical protein
MAGLSASRYVALAGAVVLVAGACAAPAVEPQTPPPAPSRIELAALVVGERQAGARYEFDLADGRTVTVGDRGERWIVQDPADVLIVGVDGLGRWVATLNNQEGTPDGCHVLLGRSFERGSWIENEGILWPKSGSFASDTSVPPLGEPYPGGARLCVNERAEVWRVFDPQD